MKTKRSATSLVLCVILLLGILPGFACAAQEGAGDAWSYEIVLAPQYDAACDFADNGFAAVKKGDLWGYIDLSGNTVIPFRFQSAGMFSEGKAAVVPGDQSLFPELRVGMNAIIDESGQLLGEPMLANFIDGNLYRFHNGYLSVNTDFGYYIYNPDGTCKGGWKGFLDPGEEYYVGYTGPFNEGLFPAQKQDDHGYFAVGWVDSELNWVKTFEKEENAESYISGTRTFHQGIAPVWVATFDEAAHRNIYKVGFMNQNMEWIIQPQYESYRYRDESEQICFGEDGVAIVKKDGKFGGIDLAGNTVIPFQYEELQCASDGLVAYKENDKWGYLDAKNGSVAIPACYTYAGSFSNGLAVVYDGERTHVIDTSGKELTKLSQLDLTYYITEVNVYGETVFCSKPLGEYVVFEENGLFGFAHLTKEAAPSAPKVQLSPQNLTVDGAAKDVEKYNIDGSNYFKLRDIAYLLNGTGSQFSVGWDAATGTVSIVTGEAYEPNGSEMIVGADKSATAQASAQTIKINGEVRSDLSVYNLDGNNFFKLRDLGTALGFEVDYDAATNTAIVISK